MYTNKNSYELIELLEDLEAEICRMHNEVSSDLEVAKSARDKDLAYALSESVLRLEKLLTMIQEG